MGLAFAAVYESVVLPSRKIAAAVASASIRARRQEKEDKLQVDIVPFSNRVQFLVCRIALQTTFKAGLPVSVAHFSIPNRSKHQR